MDLTDNAKSLEKAALQQRWRDSTKCKGMNVNLWFPPRDRDQYKQVSGISKGVCLGKDGKAPCPVRKECLLFACLMEEQHGIWGGKSHRERNAMERKAAANDVPVAIWIKDNVK